MRDPEPFDAFYAEARTRLLVLTYCLTGDLAASRSAVRDAFVEAWHHWRKVSRLEDPEAWVRVRACRRAQARHTAKPWHREKGIDPEVRATLDALGRLSALQRRTLLLTELTTASLTEIAREVGLPRADAERELQLATAQLSVHRGVPTTGIRALFEPVRAHVADTRWPRTTIVRRSGAARRRTHTLVGVVATVALLLVTGTLVGDAAGVRPTLARDESSAARPASSGESAEPAPPTLPADALLTSAQVARRLSGSWQAGRTDDNTSGDGLVAPCQTTRYADPRARAALVRTFRASGRHATGAATTQMTTVSGTDRAAARGYRTAVAWYAGCGDERAQLLHTLAVRGVGDEAALLVLRSWAGPGSAVVAGVARTGRVVTTTVTRTPPPDRPALRAAAALLGRAVSDLCTVPDGGSCAAAPRLAEAPPTPVASVPTMLGEVDLPPVSGVAAPWVGTEPRQPRTNPAATGCDRADFSAAGIRAAATRTFLVPDAKVPDEFGLTETIGTMAQKRAAAFVAQVRAELAACPDKAMGTKVARMADVTSRDRELAAWRLDVEITDARTVRFLMGITRAGGRVAQVGFVPTAGHEMAPGAFVALLHRAQDRLAASAR